MKLEENVKLGIVGLGNMGTAHARNIIDGKVPGMALEAISDVNPMAKEKFPDVSFFDNASSMIQSGTINAILIATPHYDHTTIGIEALKAGLHVLVEKPISVHKADCEELIAAHTNSSQVFAAMFNQRTDPRYQKLKALIDSGELGKINRINWIITDWFRTEQYYTSGGWRATWGGEGGGVLLNQCPHQLDLWQWLFGMPNKIRGHCSIGKFHNIEVEDDVTAYFEYDNGATGIFITTTGEAPGTNRLEIAAERGRIVIEGEKFEWLRNETETQAFSKESKTSFDKPDHWKVEIPVEGQGEKHIGIMKDFCSAILEGTPLLAPAKEGIHSVELANAILHSSDTQSTIELPLDSASFAQSLKKKIESSTFEKAEPSTKSSDEDFGKSF